MTCEDCTGSGACDVCQGYGTTPDTYPSADDGSGCPACASSGVCPGCHGTTQHCTTTHLMSTEVLSCA